MCLRVTKTEHMFIRSLSRHWSRHLYLRIWLAVVAGVALLMLVVGWAWRATVEHHAAPSAPREWVVLNAQGEVLDSTTRPGPGEPLTFEVKLPDGQQMQFQVQRSADRTQERSNRAALQGLPGMAAGMPHRAEGRMPPHLRKDMPWWAKPSGFFWMLGLIGLAVALGLYPVVRRLTQRLEGLQRGVQRWGEGDLSVRVPVQGDDEVADLSERFNAAATRIEGLMASQKSLLANASHELRSPLARISVVVTAAPVCHHLTRLSACTPCRNKGTWLGRFWPHPGTPWGGCSRVSCRLWGWGKTRRLGGSGRWPAVQQLRCSWFKPWSASGRTWGCGR
jgi:two-component system, OmpR family, sensor kinase